MIVGRRFAWFAGFSGLASAIVLVGACSTSSSGAAASAPDGPESAPGEDGGQGDDATNDAKSDRASDALSSACEGSCKTTSLVASFGGKTRTLVRAQFGTQLGDAGAELHTESHLGGAVACPSQQSPSPDYTLIVTAIARGAAGRKLTKSDGITSAFFDFKGDLGVTAPSGITKASSVEVTVVAEDTATPPAWVALDVTAAFAEGTVVGHLYAEYCQSLSE